MGPEAAPEMILKGVKTRAVERQRGSSEKAPSGAQPPLPGLGPLFGFLTQVAVSPQRGSANLEGKHTGWPGAGMGALTVSGVGGSGLLVSRCLPTPTPKQGAGPCLTPRKRRVHFRTKGRLVPKPDKSRFPTSKTVCS